jgi:ammonium transporter Rh
MIFVGFGFLMVFLKCHSWTSVGFNFIIAAWSIQLCILCTGFWHQVMTAHDKTKISWHKIGIDIQSMILADFCAGAVLITFGVILGKCNLL